MRLEDKFSEQRIQDIVKLLKSSYDCIERLEAIFFVKESYPNTDIRIINRAYNLAYPIG